ncbi:hypothetical protein Golax_000040 [Gossypium laxum]|uniref:DUF7745 domain-containing protein n=1 Tax=Gossypium laxum TaxID=34288 RepID=A0A7J9AZG1_9ROSI|nr:hypothetical protein [Gossypium laxum]
MNTLREDLLIRHGVENIEIIVRIDEAKKMHFRDKYGNVAQLLFVKLNDALLKAMVRFWDPTYRCFTFNEVDMIPTIEEYSTFFHYDFRDPLRIY